MTHWQTRTYPADLDGTDTYSREYDWVYDGRRFTWDLTLPKALYRARQARTRIYDYGAYVADRLTRRTFDEFCTHLAANRREFGFSPVETVTLITRFVQQLEYTPDSVSTAYDNYPRYPIETLVDETGDCEDASLLLATLLHGLGYQVGLLEFDSHLAVGVHLPDGPETITFGDTSYAYVETTGEGWEVGEVPDRYRSQSATLHRVDDAPLLHTTWRAQPRDGGVACRGSVLNTGTGAAANVTFRLRLTTPDGKTHGRTWQEWSTIRPTEAVRWQETLAVPAGRRFTPHWTLAIDRIVHDEGSGAPKRV